MLASSLEISGVIRRRRDFSKHLSFFTVEIDPEHQCSYLSVQLVCDGWMSPRSAIVGVRVNARGSWDETKTNIDGCNNSKRFLVEANMIMVNTDNDDTNQVKKEENYYAASEHVLWRAKVGATCSCADVLCPRSHGDGSRYDKHDRQLQHI